LKRRILAFLIVLVLAGFTVGMKIASHPAVDRWLRNTIIEQAQKHLGVHLQLGSLERNLTLTNITLTDVTLRDLKGTGNSISVSRLVVTIDPYAFFRGKIVIEDLKLEGMFLDIVRREDGTIAVDPLFPFWETQPAARRQTARLGLEIGNVAFLNVDLLFRDIPAGARVRLDGVAIILVRSRFDPPGRRTINIRAKEGEIAWKAFPEGRTVDIKSFSGAFALTPDEMRISKLALDTGPVRLELSGGLPFKRGAVINGDLSASLDIDKLPWLVPDSGGRLSLDGKVGGDLSKPSFKGKLSGVDVRFVGRVMSRINADLYLDPRGCTLGDGKIEYNDESLFSEVELAFKRSLPFGMRIRAEKYPLHKVLEEVGGSMTSTGGYVSADLIIKGQISGGASTIAMKGDLGLPVGAEALRALSFDLSGRYEDGSLKDLLFSSQSGGMQLALGGILSPDGPSLELSLVDKDLANWHDVSGLEDLGGSLVLNGIVKGNWENVESGFDLELLNPSWGRFRGDLLQAHVDMDSSGLGLPMLTLKAGSCVLVGRASLPLKEGGKKTWVDVSITDGRIEDLLGAAGLALDVRGDLGGNLYLSSTASGWEGRTRLKSTSEPKTSSVCPVLPMIAPHACCAGMV